MLMPGQKEQCLAPADRPSADKPSAAPSAAAAAAEEPDEAADDDEELTDAAIAKNIAKLKSMGGSAKSVGKPAAFRKKSSTNKMEVRRPSAARPSGPLAAGSPQAACPGGYRSARDSAHACHTPRPAPQADDDAPKKGKEKRSWDEGEPKKTSTGKGKVELGIITLTPTPTLTLTLTRTRSSTAS